MSVAWKVRCLKDSNLARSCSVWFRMKSYGAPSIRLTSLEALWIMVFLCPQAKVAAQKPMISRSWSLWNRWGMEMGSSAIKPGWLNRFTAWSSKDCSASKLLGTWCNISGTKKGRLTRTPACRKEFSRKIFYSGALEDLLVDLDTDLAFFGDTGLDLRLIFLGSIMSMAGWSACASP